MKNDKIEIKMIEELRGHLRIAKAWNWKIDKMLFIDGYLKALNIATGKNYSFSGTEIYLTDKNGTHII